MILNDIVDQWDSEDNFQYCFDIYCNYLDREGKWKLCENNSTKNNFRCRMRKQYNGDLDKNREYKKFEVWVEKRKIQEQKEVERRAIKLSNDWERKFKELEQENKSLKEQLKNEYNLRIELMAKYDSDED